MTTVDDLPKKPSDLLELALKDLELCEKDPKYSIDMDTWHIYEDRDKTCSVCLAGAVMAKSLDRNKYLDIHNTDPMEPLFKALDFFRTGDIRTGFKELRLPLPKSLDGYRSVVGYETNPKRFKAQMRELIKDFREAEL